MPEGLHQSPSTPEGWAGHLFHFARSGGLRARQLSRRAASRWKRGLLSALVSLVAVGCGAGSVIVNDLDEREANEMIVLLNGHGIDAQKIANVSGTGGSQTVTWNLSVPSSKRIESLSTLNVNGLPRRRGQTLLELFSKQGLVSSQMEEDVRYQAGLADQIANTIRKIDGVLDTDVQLSIPQQDNIPGQTDTKPVTASVYVKHSGVLDNPNLHLEIKIKRLVSGSIPGLNFDNVTVIGDSTLDRGQVLKSPSPEEGLTRLWGVDVTKRSRGALRLLVGACISLIALLGLSLAWLLWKLQRLFTAPRGLQMLLSPAALDLALTAESPPTAASGAGGEPGASAESASAGSSPPAASTGGAKAEPVKGPQATSGPLRSSGSPPTARPGS